MLSISSYSFIILKRQRADFTTDELKLLQQYYTNGMTSTKSSCQQVIEEVAEKLGTSKSRIEMWIGNHRAKLRRCESGAPQGSRQKFYKSGPNAYSHFMSSQQRGYTNGATFMRLASEKWRNLPEEEKKFYAARAKQIRDNPLQMMDRKKIIHRQLNIISTACDVLQEQGYAFGGLGYDASGESPTFVAGTAAAVQFFNNVTLQDQFRNHLNIQENLPKCLKSAETRQSLRKKVKCKFTECWEKATQEKHIPYSRIKSGDITVKLVGENLENIKFCEPSNYGKKTMRTIIENLKALELSEPSESIQDIQCSSAAVAIHDIPSSSATSNISVAIQEVPSSSYAAVNEQPTVRPEGQVPEESDIPELCDKKVAEAVNSILEHEAHADSREENEIELDPENRVTEVLLDQIKTMKSSTNVQVACKRTKKRPVRTGKRESQKKQSKKIKLEESDDKIYLVDKILGIRSNGKKKQFEVKWIGFNDTTWEPEKNLHKDLVKDFLLHHSTP